MTLKALTLTNKNSGVNKVGQKVFSLIEVMITVAIFGIVASFAVP